MEKVTAYNNYVCTVELRREAAKKKIEALREEILVREKLIRDVSRSRQHTGDILECPWNHVNSTEALHLLIHKYDMDEELLHQLRSDLRHDRSVLKTLMKEYSAADMMMCHLERYETLWALGHS